MRSNTSFERTRPPSSAKFRRRRARRSTQPLGMPLADHITDAPASANAKAAHASVVLGVTVWVLGLTLIVGLYAVERYQLTVLFFLAPIFGIAFIAVSLPCAAIVGIYKALTGFGASASNSVVGLVLNTAALCSCWWLTWVWILPVVGGSHA